MCAESDKRADPVRVLEELTSRFEELTGSQKRIVEYIVRNPDQVAFMNLDKLADAIRVSPSTIVRLCYRLDYDGFTDMQSQLQLWLRAQLSQDRLDRNDPGHPAPEASLFQKSMEMDIRNLQESRRMLREDIVKQAVDLIQSSHKIRIFGNRSAHGVAHSLMVGLHKIRSNVSMLNEADGTLPEAMMELTKQDLLIAITFPRYSSNTVDIARYAKERGARVIAITDSIISPLARVADVVLPCAYQSMGIQNSLAAALSLISGLVLTVEADRRVEYQERFRETESLVSRWDLILLGHKEELNEDR